MSARVLMVQGTMSSVGKSLIVAALCRMFKKDGRRVAPFKAQNMALNSYATLDGREVGRAQAMQAQAAGVPVTVEMNPVLIKPEADAFAQIVVMGKPWARLPAGEYMRRRSELWQVVTHALDSLRSAYDVIVVEGAGSPAEMNLRRGDIVNMPVANYADAPVLLVGDIDRGGIFAQLLGTHMLLEGEERARIKGFVVNKFRGDSRLFQDGVGILESRSGVPVIGVVPFIRDLGIADEDSVALDEMPDVGAGSAPLHIAVIRLPHTSNFDDFDPLRQEPDVALRFVDRVEQMGTPDLIILPGTKTTIADLAFLRQRGLAARIVELARALVPVIGICGGYQMMGTQICDPEHTESPLDQVEGLDLLPVVTSFVAEKQTVQAHGRILVNEGLLEGARGLPVTGYEIHMGRTVGSDQTGDGTERAFVQVTARGEQEAAGTDGLVTQDGLIAGVYIHGLFDNDGLRHTILNNLARRKGLAHVAVTRFNREVAYDRLEQIVRANLDAKLLYSLVS